MFFDECTRFHRLVSRRISLDFWGRTVAPGDTARLGACVELCFQRDEWNSLAIRIRSQKLEKKHHEYVQHSATSWEESVNSAIGRFL